MVAEVFSGYNLAPLDLQLLEHLTVTTLAFKKWWTNDSAICLRNLFLRLQMKFMGEKTGFIARYNIVVKTSQSASLGLPLWILIL